MTPTRPHAAMTWLCEVSWRPSTLSTVGTAPLPALGRVPLRLLMTGALPPAPQWPPWLHSLLLPPWLMVPRAMLLVVVVEVEVVVVVLQVQVVVVVVVVLLLLSSGPRAWQLLRVGWPLAPPGPGLGCPCCQS